jgi:uncharacterized membrane protein
MLENLIGSGFPPEVLVLIIAALPIVELRGAIPIAIELFHMPWYEALCLSIIGNMLPVPLLLLFFESLLKLVNRTDAGRRLSAWFLRKTRQRARVVERYERIGLTLFVAIPIPWTGAWTGSIVAALLGIKFSRALLSITYGVIIAGAIVVSLCLLGWVGAVIAGVGLSALAVVGLLKS